jgi:hypothetical protein
MQKGKKTNGKSRRRYLARNEEHINLLHSLAASPNSMLSQGAWGTGNLSALGGGSGSNAMHVGSMESLSPNHIGVKHKKKGSKTKA